MTSSTTLTAATTSAASSAQPKLSTTKVLSSTRDANSSTQGVEYQDEHEAEREHERQAQRREHGREQCIQDRDDDRDQRARRRYPTMSTPGRIAAATQSDAAVSDPRQQQPERLEPRPLRLPLDGLAVGGRRNLGHVTSPIAGKARRPATFLWRGRVITGRRTGGVNIGR